MATIRKQTRIQYLDNAPPYLVTLHREKKLATVGLGRNGDLLGELLTHRMMDDAWNKLKRRISTDNAWRSVWGEIRYAILASRNPPIPQDEIDYYTDVSEKARELATLLRRKSGRAILDAPAYKFCPDDVMSANGISRWSGLDSLQQASNAIIEWPTITELLDGLAEAAKRESDGVREELIMQRVARENGKPTAKARETYFLRLLHIPLSKILTAKKDGINLVLGKISAVTFSHPDTPLSPKEVCEHIHGS